MWKKRGTCSFCGGSCDQRVKRCYTCSHSGIGYTPFKTRLPSKIKINPATGCWDFQGSKLPKGYGVIFAAEFGGRQLAHRAVWMSYRGEIPPNLCVCHKCDNPGCVNPDHLFLGTNTDNMQDMWRKNRGSRVGNRGKCAGEKHSQAKLSSEQVALIRNLSAQGARNCDIAKQFNIRPNHVYKIKTGKRWAKGTPICSRDIQVERKRN